MIALQDLIIETLNIFESEDIKQLEKERMRLYMKVKNWKKSGKDVSELEKQLSDAKKRLSDAKKAARLVAKGAVVTPQQTTPTGDDSAFSDLGTDGFGALDIDSMMGSGTEEVLMRNRIKQYILDNYNINEKEYNAAIEIIEQKNGEYIVNYGLSKNNTGPTIVLRRLRLQKTATSITGGLFKWGELKKLNCANSNISTLEGAPDECLELCCLHCPNLTSLKGAPQVCEWFDCTECVNLKDLTGGPQECDNYFCSGCKKLKSLEGAPKKCNEFNCDGCTGLTSLQGAPGGCERFECRNTGINDLTGINPNVKIIDITGCKNITSLKGCPVKLKSLIANDCKKLIDVTDLPENTKVSGRNTQVLKSMKQTIFV